MSVGAVSLYADDGGRLGRTMGSECCFSSVSWFSHSEAISVATSLLSFGTSKWFPPGVRNGRLSRVTANALSRSSTPTVFQNRFNVASAPDGRTTQHTVHKPRTRAPPYDLSRSLLAQR